MNIVMEYVLLVCLVFVIIVVGIGIVNKMQDVCAYDSMTNVSKCTRVYNEIRMLTVKDFIGDDNEKINTTRNGND